MILGTTLSIVFNVTSKPGIGKHSIKGQGVNNLDLALYCILESHNSALGGTRWLGKTEGTERAVYVKYRSI